MQRLVEQGKIRWFGVSVFLPEEALAVLKRGAGHSIQLAFNALRQEMATEVLPLARKKDFGVIARVPLYYGMLAGKFTAETRFASNDHRSHTLPPETMRELAPRAERLRQLAKVDREKFGEWSLRFILAHEAVSTVIPGARNVLQAERNCAASSENAMPQKEADIAHTFWQQDSYLRNLRTGL